jgi:hypothetical protein
VAAGAASTRRPFDEPTVDQLLAEPIVQQLMRATGTASIEGFFPEREQFQSFIVDSHVSLLRSATRDRLTPRPGVADMLVEINDEQRRGCFLKLFRQIVRRPNR